MLKRRLLLSMLPLLALMASVPQAGHSRTAKKGKLLYMTLTKGYHHQSVELMGHAGRGLSFAFVVTPGNL